MLGFSHDFRQSPAVLFALSGHRWKNSGASSWPLRGPKEDTIAPQNKGTLSRENNFFHLKRLTTWEFDPKNAFLFFKIH